jgi:hypothetical protein
LSNFYKDVLSVDARFTSTAVVRDLWMLEPFTRAAVQGIIADAALKGIDLRISETYRSKERQIMLFKQGATKLQNVGVHHYGLACDFYKVIAGQPSWAGDWSFLRDLAEDHGLISGLDWGLPAVRHTFIDPDHVQYVSLAQQNSLFAGTWYPEPVVNPNGNAVV